MKMLRTWALVWVIGVGVVCPVTRGEELAAGSNTVITAEQLLFDYTRMIAVFEGNVNVRDPQVLMTCDKLNVLFEGTNSVKSVTAFGNVRVYTKDKRAESDQAVYMAQSGEIELLGNAKLFSGLDTVLGRKITFWLNEDKMKCVPAKLIIHSAGNKGDMNLLPGLPTPAAGRKPERDSDENFMQGR